MNKKFFAALASATMAFTASGSIAVFADDFVEENTPSVDAGDLKPVAKKVVFNKENFGSLVDKANVTFTFADGSTYTVTDLKVDEEIETKVLAAITEIKLGANFEGNVKGLEYFTGLTLFDDNSVKNSKKVTTETLDFSANTKLKTLTVKKSPELAEIKLPKADEDEVYHLVTLNLDGTKLTALDLSKQEALKDLTVNNSKLGKLDLSALEVTNVTATKNYNLEEVVLNNGRKGKETPFGKLVLSDNALETVNLDYVTVTGTLNLSGNHIGALDLSKTKVEKSKATLGNQTFFVSEDAANVKLTEAFPTLKTRKVKVDEPTKFDEDTGVLTLETTGTTTYEYDTLLGATNKTLSVKLTAANPMNRLYNPNSGEHFYTADLEEKAALVNLGWNDEGYGWVAPSTDENDTKKGNPVFRLYNANAGDHHYTMDQNEVKTLVAYGWKDEGTGWYSASDAAAKVEVYRQYNPYANGAGSHNYTTDKAENNYLVSLGWIYEGTAWTALQ